MSPYISNETKRKAIEQARRSTAFILYCTPVVAPLLSLRYCAHTSTGKSFLQPVLGGPCKAILVSRSPGSPSHSITTPTAPNALCSMGLQSEVILEPWPDDMGHGAVDHPGSFRGLRFEGVGEQLPAANRNVPP